MIKFGNLRSEDYLFRSRVGTNQHISTGNTTEFFCGWVAKLGLEDSLTVHIPWEEQNLYLIYKKTKNLRVIQLLLGHKKLESTVRYLGIEVDDALEISESIWSLRLPGLQQQSYVPDADVAHSCKINRMSFDKFLT